MHVLDLSTYVWRLIELSGKKEKKSAKSKTAGKLADVEMEADTSSTTKTQGYYLL